MSLIFSDTKSQTFIDGQKGVSIDISAGNLQYRDLQMTGLRNSGLCIGLGARRNFVTPKLFHDIGGVLWVAALKDRYDIGSSLVGMRLGYSAFRKARRFLVGGRAEYGTMLYENENFDSQHNYWVSTVMIGPHVVAQREVNGNLLFSAFLSVPVFGMISRPAQDRSLTLNEPDLNKWDVVKRTNSHYRPAYPAADFICFSAGVYVHSKLRNGLRFAIGYNLRYEQTKLSSVTQLLGNSINLQLNLSRSGGS